nr:hypothetical protein [Flavisolibacter sp.]
MLNLQGHFALIPIMNKNLYVSLFLLLTIFGLHAQDKKWTLAESVDYALKNNISIKQTELDTQLAAIDKR